MSFTLLNNEKKQRVNFAIHACHWVSDSLRDTSLGSFVLTPQDSQGTATGFRTLT